MLMSISQISWQSHNEFELPIIPIDRLFFVIEVLSQMIYQPSANVLSVRSEILSETFQKDLRVLELQSTLRDKTWNSTL